MSESIENLLAVLDMTEEEQEEWIIASGLLPEEDGIPIYSKPILADFAFRLRDEVTATKEGIYFWDRAMAEVCREKDISYKEFLTWCHAKAQPPDWIIAAEIAKILAEK